MKRLLYIFLLSLITSIAYADRLSHPLDFKGTEKEKNYVVSYIKGYVKEIYSKIGMGDPSTLRKIENEEWNSFEQLTKVNNRKLLDDVIKEYCKIPGMCTYGAFLIMYDEKNKASK